MNEPINLSLKPAELDYIAQLLSRQPWSEVNALLVNMQQQVKEQQNASRNPNGARSGKAPGSPDSGGTG